jgi:hypothetical protein
MVLTTCAKNVLRMLSLKDVNQVIHIPTSEKILLMTKYGNPTV